MKALKYLWICFIFVLFSCDKKQENIKEKEISKTVEVNPGKKTKSEEELEAEVKIRSNEKPKFVSVWPVYSKNKFISTNNLRGYNIVELNLLRVQLYYNNQYDFETAWKNAFFKTKYGFVLKPIYSELKLANVDYQNELRISQEIQRQMDAYPEYSKLPVYIGHILREINKSTYGQRYYLECTDKDVIPFKREEIPIGFKEPELSQEIEKKQWMKLLTGQATFLDLNLPKDKNTIYLTKNHPNGKLKYIITFEAYGGVLSPQDARNFSLYDDKGILRRSIFLVGDSELYERDYYYDKSNTVNKIIEKVTQNNSLSRVHIFVKPEILNKELFKELDTVNHYFIENTVDNPIDSDLLKKLPVHEYRKRRKQSGSSSKRRNSEPDEDPSFTVQPYYGKKEPVDEYYYMR